MQGNYRFGKSQQCLSGCRLPVWQIAQKGQGATLPLQYILKQRANPFRWRVVVLNCSGGPDVAMMGGGVGGVSAII